MKVARALLSVWDKTGIVEFARGLADLGVELLSTGGTAAALRGAEVPVIDLVDVTRSPEILGGRVKTLHPAIHGGLLALRGDQAHMAELARHGIRPIDLIAVTLYPFEAAVAGGADLAAALEQIDVGGVTLLRAAAKNFGDVVVLSRPSQYGDVLDMLRRTGTVDRETRLGLAREAFARTSGYDAAIARYLDQHDAAGVFPPHLVLAFEKAQDLRYGENPHQRGAFYREPGVAGPSVATARQVAGKPLSYNNIADLDVALELAREFEEPVAVIVKHGIPCGVGTGSTLREAYLRAREGDPVSAFGGIVALNRPVDRGTGEALAETFLEAVIAPRFDEDALAALRRWKSLRLMEVAAPGAARPFPVNPLDLRRVQGGLLVQERDAVDLAEDNLKVVTSRAPTAQEWIDLRFAWTVCRYVRSNAIVFARDRQVVGVGAGQMNRVESVRLAARQAGERARGAAMASEAFFPFPDGLEVAIQAGVTAVIHPGGSVRDAEVTAAAEAAGIAMVLTGIRHFRH
ncbi:MAG: bifunctional phosphoribosylaminoimidazolecarboxamide formyltransferase/IMP cyclohydrolase [Bacillati bacterium ANGP1]|uniref:Bifunctional purine biosynthesis protein PurH n=1 Tax=Candidatus Segetimicrobium genomatis TaxID=2569760 RepID=A0A537LIX1_9BACT|nr:MAG: bifunctional phosphoribosylaminoimidazolecarboxamide formyltransferase/IMP cyclohydrolase [Terrabacteria group bacterium ANGP1]